MLIVTRPISEQYADDLDLRHAIAEALRVAQQYGEAPVHLRTWWLDGDALSTFRAANDLSAEFRVLAMSFVGVFDMLTEGAAS